MNNLTHLLCFTNRRITQRINAFLDREKITLQQMLMLQVINQNPLKNLTWLGDLLYMNRTTFSRNIRLIIKNGWVVTKKSTDGRMKTYKLSPNGLLILRTASNLVDEYALKLEKDLGSPLYQQLRADLAAALLTSV